MILKKQKASAFVSEGSMEIGREITLRKQFQGRGRILEKVKVIAAKERQ